jgi:hypothetical protein
MEETRIHCVSAETFRYPNTDIFRSVGTSGVKL